MSFITTRQAADLIGVNRDTVRRWCDWPVDPLRHVRPRPGPKTRRYVDDYDLYLWLKRHKLHVYQNFSTTQIEKMKSFMREQGPYKCKTSSLESQD